MRLEFRWTQIGEIGADCWSWIGVALSRLGPMAGNVANLDCESHSLRGESERTVTSMRRGLTEIGLSPYLRLTKRAGILD